MNLSDGILQEVDAQTLKQWIEQETVLLIDVRESIEYSAEHIVDANLLPLSKFHPKQVMQEPEQRIVLYCRSGHRSSLAARKLLDAGFIEVSHLTGGLTAWKAAGYAIAAKPNAPISLMRQVQIVAGSLILIGTVLGAFVSSWFLLLSGFVGGGLVIAGITNTCAIAMLLAKLPYNQQHSAT